jgi:hypothetical protein
VACGGGDGGDPDANTLVNHGFATPTVTMTAHQKSGTTWTDVGPADWSCLNTATDDVPAEVPTTVSGIAYGRNTDMEPVEGATLTAYAGTDFGTELDSTTTSEEDGEEGAWEVGLPAGRTRVAYKTVLEGYVDTYLINQYYEPDATTAEEDIEPVSDDTAETLLALINLVRDADTGILAGAIRDCEGHEVAGAIATVSATQGTPDHIQDAETFYFSAGAAKSLPVIQDSQHETNKDGLFMVVELPVSGLVYFQVWGFRDDQDPASDELTLIAELGAPVFANSIVTASLEARRTE